MERAVSISVIEPALEYLPGIYILPWQLALLREEAVGRPPLTNRMERYIGLMAHVALYGIEDGTEILEEGLGDRLEAYSRLIYKCYDLADQGAGPDLSS